MIEISTSIAFFLASMYGATSIPTTTPEVIGANAATSTMNSAIVTVTSDRKTIEKYLREHFADTPILVDIARCESTFVHYDKNGEIVRGRVNNADVGVMQINEKYHLEDAKKLGYDIHTIEGNVDYAKYLYEKYGADPWSASSKCWIKTISANQGGEVAIK
ncbi:MAG: hypothetical protein WCP89_04470 [archaeon]